MKLKMPRQPSLEFGAAIGAVESCILPVVHYALGCRPAHRVDHSADSNVPKLHRRPWDYDLSHKALTRRNNRVWNCCSACPNQIEELRIVGAEWSNNYQTTVVS